MWVSREMGAVIIFVDEIHRAHGLNHSTSTCKMVESNKQTQQIIPPQITLVDLLDYIMSTPQLPMFESQVSQASSVNYESPPRKPEYIMLEILYSVLAVLDEEGNLIPEELNQRSVNCHLDQ
jgi:hypothetical protein